MRTLTDVNEIPVQPVTVRIDGVSAGSTNASGMLEVQLSPGTHNVSVASTRTFSHFWDSDCSQTSNGYYLDTGSNPYTFTMKNSNRMITAYYLASTSITGLSFSGVQISGRLLDERGNALRQIGGYHPVCENSSSNINNKTINRNVTLEYSTDDGATWTRIATVDALADGTFSSPFSCPSGVNKIRATYTSTTTNWYYNSSSVVLSTTCSGTCTPSCSGKECGPDGCGGTCPPGCSVGQTCNAAGQCVTGTTLSLKAGMNLIPWFSQTANVTDIGGDCVIAGIPLGYQQR